MAEKSRRRGSIVQRGEGRWLVRVFRGIDPGTGKRQYHNETVRGTKSEVRVERKKKRKRIRENRSREEG